MVNVRKRGKGYQYYFEIAPVNGKRKQQVKSGFKTKKEAEEAGIKAYNEYNQTGHSFTPATISYSDYLDYWLENYCHINLKYHTIQAYTNIIKNHIKPRLGFYRLAQITTSTLQEFMNNIYVEKAFSKNFLKNILKVLKTSFGYAANVVGFIKENPAKNVTLPKYDIPDKDPAHIFTNEEINMMLQRFKNNHAMYYAILTAYCTGLRAAELFALTWDDIDFERKTLTVNKNILKKNQSGATHGRHISGKATTVWYFGTCKTPGSYRTIEIGDTLVKALKEYKEGASIRMASKMVENDFKLNGYDLMHSLGHGVGLDIHEMPFINGKNDNTFKANMVVTNEPGIYIPGAFGVRIEDTVLITKSGCINLTKSDKNYIVVDK